MRFCNGMFVSFVLSIILFVLGIILVVTCFELPIINEVTQTNVLIVALIGFVLTCSGTINFTLTLIYRYFKRKEEEIIIDNPVLSELENLNKNVRELAAKMK